MNEREDDGVSDWSKRMFLFILCITMATCRILFYRSHREHFVFYMIISVVGAIIIIFWGIPL